MRNLGTGPALTTLGTAGQSDTTRSLHVKVILRDFVSDYQSNTFCESIYRQLCGYGPLPEVKLTDDHEVDIELKDTVLSEAELKEKLLWNNYVAEIKKVFPVEEDDWSYDEDAFTPLAARKYFSDVEDIGESVPNDWGGKSHLEDHDYRFKGVSGLDDESSEEYHNEFHDPDKAPWSPDHSH